LELNPKQALCLFGMLFGQTEAAREPMQSRLEPALSAQERLALVSAGLLETERRGRAVHLIATDAAWQWAGAHLATELAASKAASPILRALLTQLGQFLEPRGLVLADVMLRPDPSRLSLPDGSGALGAGEQAREQRAPSGQLRGRIRDTVLGLTGGRSRQRVRLAALRERLPELPRRELDSILLAMQSDEQLVLYRLDNPAELRPADEQAALLIGTSPRHLVYLES
jgi:hypothetical protein